MAGVAVARGAVTKEGPPLWEDPDHMSIKEFKTRRAKDLGETQSTISSKANGDMTSVVRALAGAGRRSEGRIQSCGQGGYDL